ncbi:MAG: hypothetical protein EKK29_05075 [Hyphomicrobiales bacterium]|nr:MAG: hypothetical protein EKK29_05075 [Hyphomicrobiales bacterium]
MTQEKTMKAPASAETIVNGLGWFSLGLGLIEVFAPGSLARPLGMERQSSLLRTYGLREIIAGLGILMSRRPTAWLWARAFGDVLDMVTVAPKLGSREGSVRKANGLAAMAIGLVAALDVYYAMNSAR